MPCFLTRVKTFLCRFQMERSNGCFCNEEGVPEGHTPQKKKRKTGQPKALCKSYRVPRPSVSGYFHKHSPRAALELKKKKKRASWAPQAPSSMSGRGGRLVCAADPQLWAFSSEGLHFLPPQVRPSADSGFSLQDAPLFCNWGRERELCLHVVGWGRGRKNDS